MATFDSLVRTKQLNKPELSGYVVDVLMQYLRTGNVTGIAMNTGQLTGQFYPLRDNVSGYITTGQLTGYATMLAVTGNNLALLASIDQYYYPRNNPTGYITSGAATSGWIPKTGAAYGPSDVAGFTIYDQVNSGKIVDFTPGSSWKLKTATGAAVIDFVPQFYPRPNISGFDIWTNSINGGTVLNGGQISGRFVSWDYVDSGKNFSLAYLSLITPASSGYPAKLKFSSTGYYLQGYHPSFPSELYTIDLFGSTHADYGVTSDRPFIYGFDIYGGDIKSSGFGVLTTKDLSGLVTTTTLSGMSGSLVNADAYVLSTALGYVTGTGNYLTGIGSITVIKSGTTWIISGSSSTGSFSDDGLNVRTTGTQFIFGDKQFYDNIGDEVLGTQSRTLYDTFGLPSAQWGLRTLSDAATINSVEWNLRRLKDNFGNSTVDWQSGYLRSGSIITLDWQKRILSGDWNVNGNLFISGQKVLTGAYLLTRGTQTYTGSLNFVSGNLTVSGKLVATGGPYYPRGANPSGYFTRTGVIALSDSFDSGYFQEFPSLVVAPIVDIEVNVDSTVYSAIPPIARYIAQVQGYITGINNRIVYSEILSSGFYDYNQPVGYPTLNINWNPLNSYNNQYIVTIFTQAFGGGAPALPWPSGAWALTTDNKNGILYGDISGSLISGRTGLAPLGAIPNFVRWTGFIVDHIQVTGKTLTGNVAFTGIGGVNVSTSGNMVVISGGASSNNSAAGVSSLNGVTGIISLTGTGNISLSVVGQTFYISGSSTSDYSGKLFQKSLYIESPRTGEDIAWLNKEPVSLYGIVTVARGTGVALGWTLRQTYDRSITGSLVVSGYSDSVTTGNSFVSFTNPTLSGDTFTVFNTQLVSGTFGDFSLNIIGNPVIVAANLSGTGQFITTAQTGHVHSQYLTGPYGVTSLLTTGFVWSGGAVTGITYSGNVLISGGGNVSVFTGATSGFQSIIISGNTGNLVFQGNTGQFAPSGMTGQFITTAQTGLFYAASNPAGYITSAQAGGVSAVSVTGASLSGNVNFTGLRGINVSLSGQYVLISGGDTGQFITTAMTGGFGGGGSATAGVTSLNGFTGAVSITGTGNVSVSVIGQVFYISGASTSDYSGKLFQKSAYIENPSTGENIAWFNKEPVSLYGVVTVLRGSGGLGWTLNQSYDRSLVGSLVLSGFTDSSTSGNSVVNFTNPTLSGDVFAIFKTQTVSGGTLNDFSLTLIGAPLIVAANFSGQTGQFITTAQTGQFAPSGMTGQFITTAQTGHIHSQYLTGPYGVTSVGATGFIWSGSAVTGINYSGAVLFTGAGNVTVFTGAISGVPNVIVVSGATGNLVFQGMTGQFITTAMTGGFGGGSSVAGVTSLNGFTGAVSITGTGNISISVIGKTFYISGSSSSDYSGKLFQKNLYVENPTNTENIAWFNKEPVSLYGVVTVLRGTGALGWTLSQSYDRSITGSLVLSGYTDSLTTGNSFVNFTNPLLSGDVFPIFNTQTLSGTILDFSLNLIGSPLIVAANLSGYVQTGITGNAFYPRFGNPAGYLTSSQAGGMNSIIVTGNSLSGNVTISGVGGISVTTGYSGTNTVLISGWDTGQYITTAMTGQFAPSGMTGQFITTAMTGGFGGGSAIRVSSFNGFTGGVSITGTGNVGITVIGQTFYISGSIDSSYSGKSYQKNVYIESPTSSENVAWFNKDAISLYSVVTVSRGSGAALGWTLNQSYDRSLVGSTVLSGYSDSLTTGNSFVSFVNPILSGDVFVIFNTQTSSGTIADFSLNLVGAPLIIAANLGNYVQTGITGNAFYPRFGNPAGYLTASQAGGVSTIIVTGTNLSGNITISGIGGISVTTGLSGTNMVLISGWDTGQYITSAMTGQFAPSGKTGQFITTAQTGQFAPSGMTGQFVTTAQTGHIHSQYLTGPYGVTSLFTTGFVWSGTAVTGIVYSGNILISGGGNISVFTGTTSGFQSIIISGNTGNFVFQGMTGQFVDTSKTGGFVSISQTGQFITTAQTGIFYPASNPNNYITSAQAGGVSAITVTGASVSGNVNFTGLRGINVSLSGQYVLISGGDTGQFITTSQTGQFAPSGMTGQFVTSDKTGGFVSISQTGQFIDSSLTGGFVYSGNTGKFLTTGETRDVAFNGFSQLAKEAQTLIAHSQTRSYYYPNIATYENQISPVTGAVVFNTPIYRTENRMVTFHVKGYNFNAKKLENCMFVAYANAGVSGNIDGLVGNGAFYANCMDYGNSVPTPKFVGLNRSGYLAIVIGNTGDVRGWDRYTVDVWSTFSSPLLQKTGWSWSLETGANFDFVDVTGFSGNASFLYRSETGTTIITSSQTGQFLDSSKTGQFITTAQTGQFAPSGMTGQFITTAQTGIFYPASNPNNYITSAQAGGVSAITVTGTSISGSVNFTGLRGINISISGQYILVSGGDTGQFITTAQTGQYAPAGLTGQFVTTNKTGGFIDSSMTGQFAPSGMTGQFITTAQTGIPQLLLNVTGQIMSGNIPITGISGVNIYTSGTQIVFSAYNITSATGQFVTSAQTGQYVTTTDSRDLNLGVITGTKFASASIDTAARTLLVGGTPSVDWSSRILSGIWTADTLLLTGSPVVTASQSGLLTNAFYPRNSNPAGYLTSSAGGGVSSITATGFQWSGSAVTGQTYSGAIIFTGIGNITVITGAMYTGYNVIVISGNTGNLVFQGNTGQFAPSGMTGQFITTAQTGQFAPSGMTGQFVTTSMTGTVPQLLLNVTGQILSGNLPITGISGIRVYTSGQFLVISGGGPAGQTGPTGPAGGVNTITPTGFQWSGSAVTGVSVSGNLIFSGAGNITVSTGKMFSTYNVVVFSGNTGNLVFQGDTGQFATRLLYSGGSSLVGNVRITGQNGIIVSGGSASDNMIFINPCRGTVNLPSGDMKGFQPLGAQVGPYNFVYINWNSGEFFQFVCTGSGYGGIPTRMPKTYFIHTGVVNGKTITCSFMNTGVTFFATNGNPEFSGEGRIYSGIAWASSTVPSWAGLTLSTTSESHADVYEFTCINKTVYGRQVVADGFIPGVITL